MPGGSCSRRTCQAAGAGLLTRRWAPAIRRLRGTAWAAAHGLGQMYWSNTDQILVKFFWSNLSHGPWRGRGSLTCRAHMQIARRRRAQAHLPGSRGRRTHREQRAQAHLPSAQGVGSLAWRWVSTHLLVSARRRRTCHVLGAGALSAGRTVQAHLPGANGGRTCRAVDVGALMERRLCARLREPQGGCTCKAAGVGAHVERRVQAHLPGGLAKRGIQAHLPGGGCRRIYQALVAPLQAHLISAGYRHTCHVQSGGCRCACQAAGAGSLAKRRRVVLTKRWVYAHLQRLV